MSVQCFIPESPPRGVALETQEETDLRGCFHEDSVHMCSCMLTETPGAGLGKRHLAKEAESRFRKRTKSRNLGALGVG